MFLSFSFQHSFCWEENFSSTILIGLLQINYQETGKQEKKQNLHICVWKNMKRFSKTRDRNLYINLIGKTKNGL